MQFSLILRANPSVVWLSAPVIMLMCFGFWDSVQTSHTLPRNYVVIAHMHWIFERIFTRSFIFVLHDI